jgi:hypothetical protein
MELVVGRESVCSSTWDDIEFILEVQSQKANQPKVSQSNWIIGVDYKGKGLCNRIFSGCNR